MQGPGSSPTTDVSAGVLGVLVGTSLTVTISVLLPSMIGVSAAVVVGAFVGSGVGAFLRVRHRAYHALAAKHRESVDQVAHLERVLRITAETPRPEDAVTGLPGAEQFEKAVQAKVDRARAQGDVPFAVAAVRIQRVDEVSAGLGRAAAENLLREIAQRVRHSVRSTDIVARLRGETFGILFDGVSDEASGEAQVERLQDAMTRPFRVDNDEIMMRPRIGIVLNAAKYDRAEEIVRAAEITLGDASSHGRGVRVFKTEMQVRAALHLRIETDLLHAVERDEIIVHYQPIVSFRDQTVVGFEALVRWVRTSGILVSPVDFIPIAESTGAIVGIGREVLRKSCQQLVAWDAAGHCRPDLTVAVNVSAVQLSRGDLYGDVCTALRDSGLAARRLKLEVTESVVMEDIPSTVAVLTRLRALGVQIAVDDFGTGHSSLAYLQRLPIDILKVDRGFVSRMHVDRESAQIVQTVIDLAATLRLAVVAEGVETEQEYSALEAAGCQYAQGYLLSRPLPVTAVPQFLAGWAGHKRLSLSTTPTTPPAPPGPITWSN